MQHQLSREQVKALLTFYAEDKLSKKLAQYVQEHLKNCPECMEKFNHLKQILNKYRKYKMMSLNQITIQNNMKISK